MSAILRVWPATLDGAWHQSQRSCPQCFAAASSKKCRLLVTWWATSIPSTTVRGCCGRLLFEAHDSLGAKQGVPSCTFFPSRFCGHTHAYSSNRYRRFRMPGKAANSVDHTAPGHCLAEECPSTDSGDETAVMDSNTSKRILGETRFVEYTNRIA